MQEERIRIIREAIFSKLSTGSTMFTDAEVLVVAGISEEDMFTIEELCDKLATECLTGPSSGQD